MTRSEASSDDDNAKLAAWVEREVGGKVTRIDRLARWRPAWDIDVERDGQLIPLHARGDREANFAIPARIAEEWPVHDLLEANGLPVPHVFGICEQPRALVMDRLPGLVDLTFADSDDERHQLNDEYLELLAQIYRIDLDQAAKAGFTIPTDARGIALDGFARYEQVHDQLMPARDPVAQFLRKWLHRNYPKHRTQATFITYDAFQFMFEGGHITGLLDFELAQVGDPLMDLGALRVRDTIKNLGDLAQLGDRYAEITGQALDYDVIDYHTVMYNTLTVLSAGPPIAAPVRTTDLISHMAWHVNSARWALEVMADMLGFTLEAVAEIPPSPSPHHAAATHLVEGLSDHSSVHGAGDYERAGLYRVARHLRRVDEIGTEVERSDLADLSQLVGHPVVRAEATAELLRFIDQASASDDEALIRLLDRKMQRFHQLLGPPKSMLLRHPPLRSLRPGAVVPEGASDQSWPAGLIPGTG
ncbi:MAG: hypothetical protein JWL70_429 [Acidimicrobiia bacterium]|nr:hypothetical protein [Acidimicrobiia bacterium]